MMVNLTPELNRNLLAVFEDLQKCQQSMQKINNLFCSFMNPKYLTSKSEIISKTGPNLITCLGI